MTIIAFAKDKNRTILAADSAVTTIRYEGKENETRSTSLLGYPPKITTAKLKNDKSILFAFVGDVRNIHKVRKTLNTEPIKYVLENIGIELGKEIEAIEKMILPLIMEKAFGSEEEIIDEDNSKIFCAINNRVFVIYPNRYIEKESKYVLGGAKCYDNISLPCGLKFAHLENYFLGYEISGENQKPITIEEQVLQVVDTAAYYTKNGGIQPPYILASTEGEIEIYGNERLRAGIVLERRASNIDLEKDGIKRIWPDKAGSLSINLDRYIIRQKENEIKSKEIIQEMYKKPYAK